MSVTMQARAAASAEDEFRKASDEFLDQVYFRYQPSQGTLAGYHQYDISLEDFSQATIENEIKTLKEFEQRIDSIPADPASLSLTSRGDRAIVLGTIRSWLLNLEVIRMWQKDPDSYSSTAANGVFTIVERNYAPAEERMRAVIAREKQIRILLNEAHANLKNPPRIYTEIAIEQLPGTIGFFQSQQELDNCQKLSLVESFHIAFKLGFLRE